MHLLHEEARGTARVAEQGFHRLSLTRQESQVVTPEMLFLVSLKA